MSYSFIDITESRFQWPSTPQNNSVTILFSNVLVLWCLEHFWSALTLCLSRIFAKYLPKYLCPVHETCILHLNKLTTLKKSCDWMAEFSSAVGQAINNNPDCFLLDLLSVLSVSSSFLICVVRSTGKETSRSLVMEALSWVLWETEYLILTWKS